MSQDEREAVAEAISRIEPLPGNGPNCWTVEVDSPESGLGWSLSAPTKLQLREMIEDWFNGDALTGTTLGAADQFLATRTAKGRAMQ